MLAFEILVKPEQLFPFDHGEGGVEGIKIRDLDIGIVLIVAGAAARSGILLCFLHAHDAFACWW